MNTLLLELLSFKFNKGLQVEVAEDSHKSQVAFIKTEVDSGEHKNPMTIYGVQEHQFTKDAFSYVLCKN